MLDIECINKSASYQVFYNTEKTALIFVTDKKVTYTISFQRDTNLFGNYAVYHFLLYTPDTPHEKDHKIKNTILAIIESFFAVNERALFYYCDISDSKQSSRNRLFNMWYTTANNNNKYTKESGVIIVEDINHFGSIICLNDNPHKDGLIKLFRKHLEELQK